MEITIRDYRPEDETGWLRCRVLAFLQTAFFDNVENSKPKFERRAIELVAEANGEILGLIDVELEDNPGTLGLTRADRAGVIWSIAVHPDFHRRGIARDLLSEAGRRAKQAGMAVLEAWTRDDPPVRAWYEAVGFEQKTTYLHVYLTEDISTDIPGLSVIEGFAHYTGPEPEEIRRRFSRVHECSCYELPL